MAGMQQTVQHGDERLVVASEAEYEASLILDLGVSQMLCRSKEFLEDVQQSQLQYVSLADGNSEQLVLQGSVFFTSLGCKFTNVLCVLSLSRATY